MAWVGGEHSSNAGGLSSGKRQQRSYVLRSGYDCAQLHNRLCSPVFGKEKEVVVAEASLAKTVDSSYAERVVTLS
jgi:hypothetical protein